MIIETSLISLDKAVKEGQTLSKGLKVILPDGEAAEVYGFIAINDDVFSMAIDMPAIIDMPPMGECQILSNRAFFYLENKIHRFPIFRSVAKANEEKYDLYLLYMPKFMALTKYDLDYYLYSMRNENPNLRVARINGVRIEDKRAYYYVNNDDLIFKSGSKLRGISNDFAVITRRPAKISEDIKYEIFESSGIRTENESS